MPPYQNLANNNTGGVYLSAVYVAPIVARCIVQNEEI